MLRIIWGLLLFGIPTKSRFVSCEVTRKSIVFMFMAGDIRPSQTPPLNQFESPDSANVENDVGNSLSSSYDTSYGSYTPNRENPSLGSSGSSVGSNAPAYSNSFGSSSLDGANSQYNPSQTEYSFTTKKPPSVNHHYSGGSDLFGYEKRKITLRIYVLVVYIFISIWFSYHHVHQWCCVWWRESGKGCQFRIERSEFIRHSSARPGFDSRRFPTTILPAWHSV